MTTELLAALATFAFVSSITPGPNNLMLLASGTNFGFRRTVPHMFGVAIGFTVMVMLVGFGIVQGFSQHPIIYQALKVVGILYLLGLAWKIATAAAPLPDNGMLQRAAKAKPFSFWQAALFQWVNPKAWAMALTAIVAYTPDSHPMVSVFTVALVFGAVNLPSITVWVVLGTRIRGFLGDPSKLRQFNIAAALLLLLSIYPILF